MELPSPFHDLFEEFPELDEFPHLPDIATARITLFQEVQKQLIRLREEQKSDPVRIRAFKKPITFEMKQLGAKLTENMSGFTTIRLSLTVGLLSFLISQALHIFWTYLVHKKLPIHNKFPFRIMLEGQAIKTRPVAAVSEEGYNYLMSHPDHRVHKKSVVIPERQFQLPAPEAE